MVRVLEEVTIPPMPVWLAMPEALRRAPAARRVWDALAEGLAAAVRG